MAAEGTDPFKQIALQLVQRSRQGGAASTDMLSSLSSALTAQTGNGASQVAAAAPAVPVDWKEAVPASDRAERISSLCVRAIIECNGEIKELFCFSSENLDEGTRLGPRRGLQRAVSAFAAPLHPHILRPRWALGLVCFLQRRTMTVFDVLADGLLLHRLSEASGEGRKGRLS